MKLSEQIKSKIEKQKAVGHDSAAVVSYEMLNRWLDEAHELEQKLNLHSIMQAEASASAEGAAVASEGLDTVAEGRAKPKIPNDKTTNRLWLGEAPAGGQP